MTPLNQIKQWLNNVMFPFTRRDIPAPPPPATSVRETDAYKAVQTRHDDARRTITQADYHVRYLELLKEAHEFDTRERVGGLGGGGDRPGPDAPGA